MKQSGYSDLRVLGGSSAIHGGFCRADSDLYVVSDLDLVKRSYEWIEECVAFTIGLQSDFGDGLLQAANITPYNGFNINHLLGTQIGVTTLDTSAADLSTQCNFSNVRVSLPASVEGIILHFISPETLIEPTDGPKKSAICVFLYKDQIGRHHHARIQGKGLVILCAGAIGSPQLLLLSGVGPRPYLFSRGIPVAHHLPCVGVCLYDNSRNVISFIPSRPNGQSLIQVVGVTERGTCIEPAPNIVPAMRPPHSVCVHEFFIPSRPIGQSLIQVVGVTERGTCIKAAPNIVPAMSPPHSVCVHGSASSPLHLTVATAMENILGSLSLGSLGVINSKSELVDPDCLLKQLRALKSFSVDGVMVDCWWDIVGAHAPQEYNLYGYRRRFQLVRDLNLKLQVVVSFHECGGSVDNVCIPLPHWVAEVGCNNPDIFFMDKERSWNPGCLSLGIDKERVLRGRTAVECYDKYLLKSLTKAAEARCHSFWTHGPENEGCHTSQPHERFFCDGADYDSFYGRFFLNWYIKVLIEHAVRVLSLARLAFEGTSVAVKLSGVHWWYMTASHAADLTAKFHNPCNRNGYPAIATMLVKHGAALNFTCVELRTLHQEEDFPEGLVWQVLNAAGDASIPVANENALVCHDRQGYNKILEIAKPLNDPDGRLLVAFTYLIFILSYGGTKR